ncbi:MAG: alcohol dehydrogenase catalytic domain-containing protein [Deltaproteobacteria bacterium]|nr:alcohol dehydrogenase catalytic domain-containing protein [Deltaproteobacteria bacterium]
MKALVKTKIGKGFLAIQDVDDPVTGEDDVLIDIKAAGICGTDLHIMEDRFPYIPPVILGHEFSGQILQLGKNVKGFEIGDRVVAEPHKGGCGACRYCLTGEVEVCREKKAIGYKIDGCFSSHLALPASSLHRIPDNVSYDQAALAEPLAVVVKAVLERARVDPEDFVLVSGCGPIGLLSAAAAKAEGARSVMITGTNGDEKLRLPVAREMGIDHVVNVEKESPVEKVMQLTHGAGADMVVEASGAEVAIAQSFDMAKIDGRICGLGLSGKETTALPWDTMIKKAANVICSFSSNWTSWERALSLMSGVK